MSFWDGLFSGAVFILREGRHILLGVGSDVFVFVLLGGRSNGMM